MDPSAFGGLFTDLKRGPVDYDSIASPASKSGSPLNPLEARLYLHNRVHKDLKRGNSAPEAHATHSKILFCDNSLDRE
jgi:hypothetical protein